MAILNRVYLVGAGPGDPALITVKGRQVLEKAEVVLYDHLAHHNLLRYCSPESILVDVGKEKGAHRQTQTTINTLIAKYISEGKSIVRLKGGDPMIFGRGGEELQFLSEKKIPYEIIPGVSSAIAGPTYAGIPLTMRNVSQSVAFVTGTTSEGTPIEEKPLPEADTLVVLMCITHLETIVERLKNKQRFSEITPAALLYRATTSDQRVVVGTLETIVQKKKELKIEAPSLLIVGEVVSYQETLSWWDRLPLAGKRVIIMRQKEQASDLASRVGMLGAEVVIIPMIETQLERKAVSQVTSSLLDQVTDIVFTSPNGVKNWMKSMQDRQLDSRYLAGKILWSVGPKTTQTLSEYGLRADKQPNEYSSNGVVASLDETLENRHFLLPLATGAKDTVEAGVKERGGKVTRLSLYSTIKPRKEEGQVYDNDHVIFTSGSTVTHFFESKLWKNQKIIPYCIGKETAAEVKNRYRGLIKVAKEATIDAIIDELCNNKNINKEGE